MLGKLRDLLTGATKASREECLQSAAAALLVEAATLDGQLADAERRRIETMLAEHFGLNPQEAAEAFAEGCQAVADATDLVTFTRVIKDNFEMPERVRMIEMLWEVAYADGHLHDYEANLVRRIAGLIYVPDQDSGAARKRAMVTLGLNEGLV
jgi:uncharacterized tellurite resistance protein B-like protein